MAFQGDAVAEEEVYATLLLTDTYLPGALVLAHSLRDAATTRKLVALVTLDTVHSETITALKSVYHYVIPVPRICNSQPANLQLMNRTDLHSAFTKINLWKQTQFRKIVYVDADVVAYRAPDELFNIPHYFSAAPDIGWPDLFNSGVMVLTPNMGDYYAMMAMAERGISFDGADQGLLNMHFGSNYNRISFSYNVTPSAHYQYIPAYRYSESSISMVHFIGQNKPWFQDRQASGQGTPYDQMIGRWWAVYDRHYRTTQPNDLSKDTYVTINIVEPPKDNQVPHQQQVNNKVSHQQENNQPYIYAATWDAQIQPPPAESKPEAMNLPTTVYEMSKSSAPFVAPQRYPSPPKNMYYEVPKDTPTSLTEPPKPVFPWEASQPKATRFFIEDKLAKPAPPSSSSRAGSLSEPSASTEARSAIEARTSTEPPSWAEASSTQAFHAQDMSHAGTQSDPWNSFTRSNVWDEVPGIERYVDSVRKRQVSKSIKSAFGQSSPPME